MRKDQETIRWVCAECGGESVYVESYIDALVKKGKSPYCAECGRKEKLEKCKECGKYLNRKKKKTRSGYCEECYRKCCTIHFHKGITIPCKGCTKPIVYKSREAHRYAYLQGGVYCSKCLSSCSKTEREIMGYLDSKKYEYEHQKSFLDCINPKTGKRLKYDFWIPKLNLLIEYDGPQHKLIGVKIRGKHIITVDDLIVIQQRDSIKTEYATKRGINLLRIPHTIKQLQTHLEKEITRYGETTQILHGGTTERSEERTAATIL